MSVEYPSDQSFFRWVLERLERGKLVAMIQITKKAGSAPRGPGTKMFVDEDGYTIGTIGGGDFERKVIEEAKKALESRKPVERKVAMFRESLYEDVIATEQLCGGVVTVFIDILKPLQRLIIVGAGHVARPLAKLGKMLNYRVVVVDNFPQYANKDRIPEADEIYASSDILAEIDKIKINKNDFVVIVHGDGALEAEVLKKIFREGSFPRYLGLLAGKGKLSYILKSLLENGIDPELIKSKLISPIGLAVGSETPEEIAIAVMAEILKVDRGAQGIQENQTPALVDQILKGGKSSEGK